MAFTDADWQHLTARLNRVASCLKAKGATVWAPEFLPPIGRSQVDDFEAQTGLRFPEDLVDLVTKYTGGWKFYWNLCVETEGRWLEPPSRLANFGGNAETHFVGASQRETLLDCYRTFQEQIHETYLVDSGDPETLRLMPKVFPLLVCEGGGADTLVLRLDTDPAEVVYLDHEYVYEIDEEHVLGRGLGEFLRRWADVGFPECGELDDLIDAPTRQIDGASQRAQDWLRWLDDPSAT
ncbi:MAG: SMI1/KNR4 family protein [Isosphaeraceae bacterium]